MPDGYPYIGMGDGGSAGDPEGNAQNLDALLGKMLRLDVGGEKPYAIPADNPFKYRDGARPEIWAYGLRNPWRFSFDSETGDMYIGDGRSELLWEEIDFQPHKGGMGGELRLGLYGGLSRVRDALAGTIRAESLSRYSSTGGMTGAP
ncbi:MAG: PQQ-dependent sugar dehydrogenase [Thermodesulfobacteriota bacterium]